MYMDRYAHCCTEYLELHTPCFPCFNQMHFCMSPWQSRQEVSMVFKQKKMLYFLELNLPDCMTKICIKTDYEAG